LHFFGAQWLGFEFFEIILIRSGLFLVGSELFFDCSESSPKNEVLSSRKETRWIFCLRKSEKIPNLFFVVSTKQKMGRSGFFTQDNRLVFFW